jgi:ATP-dependent DNA ligase
MVKSSRWMSTGAPPFKPYSSSHPSHTIVFYAFDVLHVDGRDVTGESLTKRRARLPAIIGENA